MPSLSGVPAVAPRPVRFIECHFVRTGRGVTSASAWFLARPQAAPGGFHLGLGGGAVGVSLAGELLRDWARPEALAIAEIVVTDRLAKEQ